MDKVKMNYLKRFMTFENIDSRDVRLKMLDELFDIFSQVEDDFGISLDYNLTTLLIENEETPMVLSSYTTYDISGNEVDFGQVWWESKKEIPKFIYSISGMGDIRVDDILKFSKSLESLISRSTSSLEVKLLNKRDFWNSFGSNRISISRFADPFRLVGEYPKFDWICSNDTTHRGYVNSLSVAVKCKWIKEKERIEFRLDFYAN